MTNDTYIPVSCERHSEYELAIMHKQTLVITWNDEQDKTRHQQLMPYNIVTEQKAEYLLVKNIHGENKKIRLDKIIEAHPITNE
ncbi:MAG: transcriptional antiterminator, Rof [Gammaproteobacteria bacterium]|nr:transcriptional antiterminator, Rof [Gammaproteobacteria bacterium]